MEKIEIRRRFYNEFSHRDGCLFELEEKYHQNNGRNSCTCGLDREWNFVEKELDRAREEGIREYIELLQGLEHYEGLKMIRGLQGLDNHEKREYYDIKKRFKVLSKLTTK